MILTFHVFRGFHHDMKDAGVEIILKKKMVGVQK